MIINKITLFNYGPFKGQNEINLNLNKKSNSSDNSEQSVKSGKNIILIGGNNGSGKTSLTRAIQICLYGQAGLGSKTSKAEYYRFLDDQIYSGNTLFECTNAFVELDFDFSIVGEVNNYKIKRYWERKNNKIDEEVEIYKDLKPIEDFERNNWQEFLNDLIPQGLLKLFFFDGERITSLAGDENNYELIDSLRVLLGLDIIKQLKSDLVTYQTKNIDSQNAKLISEQINNLKDENKKLQKEKERLQEEVANITTRIDSKQNSIARAETKLRSSGGTLQGDRDSFRTNINILESEINHKESILKEMFTKTLPFIYSKEYNKMVLDRIEEENIAKKKDILFKELNVIWKSKEKDIKNVIGKNLKGKGVISVYNNILSLISSFNKNNRKMILSDNLNENVIYELKNWFQKHSIEEHKSAHVLAVEIEQKTREIAKLSKQLEYIPDNKEIAPQVESLNEMHKNIGICEEKRRTIIDKIKCIDIEISKIEREYKKEVKKLENVSSENRRLELIVKIGRVLDIYEEQLIQNKIKSLETNVLNCFNSLLRKDDILKVLEININTFEVRLKDKYDKYIKKQKLSEGEKQIYAVSMLAGIIKTSNRTFPVIFDTPLGRLDSEHKTNLVNKYFPELSHQLILLSTDTEVDQNYFSALKPYTQCTYLLDYDKVENYTAIKKGYFWK